jgi:hypothetical protein
MEKQRTTSEQINSAAAQTARVEGEINNEMETSKERFGRDGNMPALRYSAGCVVASAGT